LSKGTKNRTISADSASEGGMVAAGTTPCPATDTFRIEDPGFQRIAGMGMSRRNSSPEIQEFHSLTSSL